MLQAYVGIVSQRGIELFCSEDPDTIRILWSRVKRAGGLSACFWSVVSNEAADLIKTALKLDHRREALDLLQQSARDYGFLIPHIEEPVASNFAASDR